MPASRHLRRWKGGAPALAAALALWACAPVEPPPDRIVLSPVTFADLPGWAADRHAEALPALAKSCAAMMRLPPGTVVGGGAAARPAAAWHEACDALGRVPAGDAAAATAYFERWFVPYRAANGDEPEGLFTGYYEPELRGSRQRHGRFAVPLYIRPPDLVTVDLGRFSERFAGERIGGLVEDGALVPYPARSEIETGALAGRGLELVWVDDAVDAFFLHVQGSGRVVLDDGSVLRVGYAAANGRPYTSIGRVLVDLGEMKLDEVSMQSLRLWLAAHPERARDIMARNESYVFFRELDGSAPVGAQGVELTPGRSLAVDTRYVPLGAPVWLDTTDPLDRDRPLRRLLVAQDTGGAIRGPVRGDVFWGHGEAAAARAGAMREAGTYYLLLPRDGSGPPAG